MIAYLVIDIYIYIYNYTGYISFATRNYIVIVIIIT